MDELTFEQFYQERLEERIIAHLAKLRNISLENAMDMYYGSKMSDLIHQGAYGLQYLEANVLARMLRDNYKILLK